MADDAKVRDLVEKLLKLAAPTSGAPEPERASAALEAARLVAEHNLTFRHNTNAPSTAPSRVAHGAWVLTVALQHRSCGACSDSISPEDHVWVRIVHGVREYRHNYGGCIPR